MNEIFQQLSQQHNLSVEAIQTLWVSLQTGHGKSAQFNHPELGGMGQWMPGMIMLGDMNNHALKAKVDAVCTELVQHIGTASGGMAAFSSFSSTWWDAKLGSPSSSANSNDLAYAYFSVHHCLAVKHGERIVYYNTQPYKVSGFSVQNQQLQIQTDQGSIALDNLPTMTV